NKNIIMLLMSSLILSGCGPQPENSAARIGIVFAIASPNLLTTLTALPVVQPARYGLLSG
ncbi:hypothetical protein O5833_29120, partial [Escherichia coli]|nr:hypothetical protein [Escherichia coli]